MANRSVFWRKRQTSQKNDDMNFACPQMIIDRWTFFTTSSTKNKYLVQLWSRKIRQLQNYRFIGSLFFDNFEFLEVIWPLTLLICWIFLFALVLKVDFFQDFFSYLVEERPRWGPNMKELFQFFAGISWNRRQESKEIPSIIGSTTVGASTTHGWGAQGAQTTWP